MISGNGLSMIRIEVILGGLPIGERSMFDRRRITEVDKRTRVDVLVCLIRADRLSRRLSRPQTVSAFMKDYDPQVGGRTIDGWTCNFPKQGMSTLKLIRTICHPIVRTPFWKTSTIAPRKQEL